VGPIPAVTALDIATKDGTFISLIGEHEPAVCGSQPAIRRFWYAFVSKTGSVLTKRPQSDRRSNAASEKHRRAVSWSQ
jgi:hypothetical protein